MTQLDTLLTDGGPLLATREALDARLKAIFPPGTFEHDFIAANMTVAEWREVIRRSPLIGLSWGDIAPQDKTGRVFHGGSTWTVVLAISNSAGPLPLHVGDTHAHGLFHVVQAAVSGLHGMDVPGVGKAWVTRAQNLAVQDLDAENFGLVGVDLTVALSLPPMLEDGEYRTVATTWSFPGEGEPTPHDLPFDQPEEPAA